MLVRSKLKLSILTATALYLLTACGMEETMSDSAPYTEPTIIRGDTGSEPDDAAVEFCSAYPEAVDIYLACFTADGDLAYEHAAPIEGSVEQTLAALEAEFGVPIIVEYPAAAGSEPDSTAPETGENSPEDTRAATTRPPAPTDEDDSDDDEGAGAETATPSVPVAPAPPPPPPPAAVVEPAPAEPIIEIDNPVAITKGRVAHHAPSQMVLGQPYLLEIAIQPLQATTDIDVADASLRDAVGTGLTPGSAAPAPELEFSTTRASDVMRASLKGAGFKITQTTEVEQFLFPGEPTIWQWQVTPTEPDANLVVYSLSRVLKVNGEDRAQTVKTLPVSVTVRTLDDLLAPEADAPASAIGSRAAIPPPEASAEADAEASSMPALDAAPADAEAPILVAEAGGCTTTEGSDPARHAFVLNNQAYTAPISTLSQTHTDGDRLAAALTSSGFSVTRCEDLNQRATIKALSTLGRTLQTRKAAGKEAVSFFYYSGHGANVRGMNYILPSDLDGATPTDIRDGGVAFEDIFNRVTPVSTTSFVVFDACRTVMDDQSRGIVRSYTPVGWATGVLQAFATSPGQTAADSGLYSNVLSETMTTLDDPANVVFKRVQDAVAAQTSSAQVPVYTDATTGGDFYFKSPS